MWQVHTLTGQTHNSKHEGEMARTWEILVH